jgi:hypothetical protein
MVDFEIILRQEFVRRTQLDLMPFVGKLVILGGWKTCVMCTITRKMDGKV